ncbi:hypothetical protein RSSM_02129 [Rhodopirellula sallentina SM41]|uniref:Uncharacterized protein n=1 Tax=Rhodopirellula sallentina SM41 TaxID=1263870 RepID=M5UK83_9BACT|nr:hypothetical protein RSSM_02129 [Rhodopirellula sallentina SM41]
MLAICLGASFVGCGESQPSVPSPTERDELRDLMAKEAAKMEAKAAEEDQNPE